MAFTSGNDRNFVEGTGRLNVDAGAGDDLYIIDATGTSSTTDITIGDTAGSNRVQLSAGLTIASSIVAANQVVLTLSNGAKINILNAASFGFFSGGTIGAPTGTPQTFAQFAASTLGVATLPTGTSTATGGAATVGGTGAGGSTGSTGGVTLTRATSTVTEGNGLVFTVTRTDDTAAATYTFNAVGDTNGGTLNAATAADFAVTTGTVTLAAGEKTKTFTITPVSDTAVEGLEGFKVTLFDSTLAAVASAVAAVSDSTAGNPGQTFTLTTGVDTMPGLVGSAGTTNTDGDDTIVGQINVPGGGAASQSTYTALDNIDGGKGTNTLRINAVTAFDTTVNTTLANINTVEINAAESVGVAATQNDFTTAFASVGSLTIKGGEVNAKVGSATDVKVTNATAAVSLEGGKSQTVESATQAAAVAVKGSTGAISITTASQGLKTIDVDGGSNVTIVTTSKVTSGAISVGLAGAVDPTGTVAIQQTSSGDGVAALTGGAISVTGGTSVSVQTAALSVAKNETANNATTAGAVTVLGNGQTTQIGVIQTASATTSTKAGSAVVKETEAVTFKALLATENVVVDGLTFTASKNLTAEEVAAAFAGLTASDTQATGGKTANGIYTGALSANYTSGVATGATVTFTAKDEDETLTITSTGAVAPTVVNTPGKAAVAAVTSTNAVLLGKVVLDDHTTAAVTTINVSGYAGASTIGATNATVKLATLGLSSAETAAKMTVAATASTLALTVKSMGTAATDTAVTFTTAPETLNLSSDGANYIDLTAAATKTLNVSGTGVAKLDAKDLAALEAVAVTGTGAGVLLNKAVADTVKSVDASGATGAVTVSIEGQRATYKGSSGVDTVTLLTDTSLTKAIDLGAGNDKLVLGVAVTGSTAALSGGDGDADVLSMTAAHAVTLQGSKQSFYTNFERLEINDAAGSDNNNQDTVTVDLANLGLTNYVTSNGTVLDKTTAAKSDVLELANLTTNGTLVIAAAAAGANTFHTVKVKDAATGTADVLNIIAGAANVGEITAAGVETVNISATASTALALKATSATTVGLTGAKDVVLTTTNSTAITTFDGSAATGKLTVTSANITSAVTITGGKGDDTLTAAAGSGQADKLFGGDGKDTLVPNKGLTEMTGGAGIDTFKIDVASANVNSPSTIMDLSAGDIIKFNGATTFLQARINLDPAGNPNLVSFADAAINAITVANGMAWFQFNGNTYIVQDTVGAASSTFTNGTDRIVKIVGLVDLGSNASYNSTANTLEYNGGP